VVVEVDGRPSPRLWKAPRLFSCCETCREVAYCVAGRRGQEGNPISCCYTTVEGACRVVCCFLYHLFEAAKARLLKDGSGGTSPDSLGKRCSELGWQQGVWVAVGRDVSEQSGKAGLVGHGGRLRGTALISRERIGILLPARAEEPASPLKYCSIP
jgi:hypothetical protein